MRTGAGAAVRVVTELVDVETALGVRVQVAEGAGDGHRSTGLGLLESDRAGDGRVTLENSDSLRDEEEGIGRDEAGKARDAKMWRKEAVSEKTTQVAVCDVLQRPQP